MLLPSLSSFSGNSESQVAGSMQLAVSSKLKNPVILENSTNPINPNNPTNATNSKNAINAENSMNVRNETNQTGDR